MACCRSAHAIFSFSIIRLAKLLLNPHSIKKWLEQETNNSWEVNGTKLLRRWKKRPFSPRITSFPCPISVSHLGIESSSHTWCDTIYLLTTRLSISISGTGRLEADLWARERRQKRGPRLRDKREEDMVPMLSGSTYYIPRRQFDLGERAESRILCEKTLKARKNSDLDPQRGLFTWGSMTFETDFKAYCHTFFHTRISTTHIKMLDINFTALFLFILVWPSLESSLWRWRFWAFLKVCKEAGEQEPVTRVDWEEE